MRKILSIALVLASLAAGWTYRRQLLPALGRPARATAPTAVAAAPEPARPASPRLRTADCLHEDGLLVKAIARHDVPILDEMLAGKIDEARQYRIYYVFAAPERPAAPNYLKLGYSPTANSVIGYAPEDKFVRWLTRQALVPESLDRILALGGFQVATIYGYAELADAKARKDPVARLRLSNVRAFGAFPVLAYDFDGTDEFYRIAVVTARQGSTTILAAVPAASTVAAAPPAAAPAAATTASILEKLRAIDVIVVIDTTVSMKPYVDVLIERVVELVDAIAALPNRPTVRFGLWGYRDRVVGIGYPMDVPIHDYLDGGALLSDIAEFRRRIRAIDIAPKGSEDPPECPFDAVVAATLRSRWDQAAEKIILLVGDNENHAPEHPKNRDHLTVDRVTGVLREANVRLSSLYYPTNDVVKEQFEALARDNRGEGRSSEDHASLIAWIGENLRDRAEWIGTKLTVASRGTSAGRPEGMAEAQYTEVWEDLRRNLSADEIAQLDEASQAQHIERLSNASNVDLVWVSRQSPGGATLLREAELVTWEGVAVLKDNLRRLRDLAGRSDDWLRKFIIERMNVAVGDSDDWIAAGNGQALDVFLRARGIPVRRGVLGYTHEKLLSLTPVEKEELLGRLDRVLAFLDRFHTAENFREQGGMRYGFLDMSVWQDSEVAQ